MKKNLWILLAISALIAMLVIAGCAPKPSPTPTPTAEPTPTAPPADTKCPEVVSTDVYKYYGSTSCNDWLPTTQEAIYSNCDCTEFTGVEPVYPLTSGLFKIVITFDENIDPLMSSCLYNPGNWTFKVKNPDRIRINDVEVEALGVEINGKQVIVTAAAHESGTNTLHPDYQTTLVNYYLFCGLICSTEDAKQYAAVVNGPYNGWAFGWPTPSIADEVSWELSSTCVVADELGNWCCGYEGSDCCVAPVCEECVEPCPIGSSACL